MQEFAANSENSKTEEFSNNPEIQETEITHEEVKESDNLGTKCGEKTEIAAEIVIDIDKKTECSDENQAIEIVSLVFVIALVLKHGSIREATVSGVRSFYGT
ncbi:hypothetical protein KY289_031448 [Solanum tuberosum]|nr:hypothetical protein KY289_031448 [Solanum tuberosum]